MNRVGIYVSKILFFILFGSFAAFGSFINLYLEQVVGLTGSQIGFIMFIGLVTTVVMNPIWGYLADLTGRHVLFLKIGFFSSVILGGLYYSARTFLLICLVVVALDALRAPIIGMLEFISTSYSEAANYDYGKVRVFASIGFLLTAVVTGILVGGLDVYVGSWHVMIPGLVSLEFATFGIFIVLNALAGIVLFFLPKQRLSEPVQTVVKVEKSERQEALTLAKNRPFVFILLLTMLGFMTVESAFSYATMHLVGVLEAPESIVSLNAFFMVTPELILLPIGTALMMKMGFKNWYLFSILTMVLRLVIYGFATTPFVFILGGTVHAVMIVMHISGTMMFIRRVVPVHQLGLAFTLLASAMALSRAVLSLLFGWLFEFVSSFAVFRVAIVFVLIAFVLALKNKDLKIVGAHLKNV